ncbi:MAG: hypothetical protein ACRDFB_01230 [Rhabdochlamydiaceae bacterium]
MSFAYVVFGPLQLQEEPQSHLNEPHPQDGWVTNIWQTFFAAGQYLQKLKQQATDKKTLTTTKITHFMTKITPK